MELVVFSIFNYPYRGWCGFQYIMAVVNRIEGPLGLLFLYVGLTVPPGERWWLPVCN